MSAKRLAKFIIGDAEDRTILDAGLDATSIANNTAPIPSAFPLTMPPQD